MRKAGIIAIISILAFIYVYVNAQPKINSVSDSPDPIEVPGENNITANISNATSAYVEIYYPNSTLMGNFSMNYIPPNIWYYTSYWAYPDPLGTYSYIIKAYNESGWNSSSTYTFTLQDTTPPNSSVNSFAKYWYNSEINVTATATDNYQISEIKLKYRYSSDNSSWNTWADFETDYSPPWEWDFDFPDGEGYYRFLTMAKDTAGNIEPWPSIYDESAAYDVTPPSSSVDVMAYWYTSLPIIVTASANDSLSGVKEVTLYYRYSSDNFSWTSWKSFGTDVSPPWRWNFNAPNGDGYYEFYTKAKDLAGNIEAAPTTADESIAVDSHAPSTTIHASPSYGNYVLPSSSITLTAVDTMTGVNSTYYRIWNGSWHPSPGSGFGKSNNFYIYSGAFHLIKEGKNYVEFYSIDNVGNEEDTNNATYIVDSCAPTITDISANPSNQLKGGYVNISCIVTDCGCGVDGVYLEVTYPDKSFSNFSMNSIGSTYYRKEAYTMVGTYNFTIFAKDKLGNWERSSVHHFTIYSQNNPPITTCSLDPSSPNGKNGWYISNVNVTLTAIDPDGDAIAYTKYRINGGSWITYTSPFKIINDGENLLEFYSVDDKGSTEEIKSIIIKIDKSKPHISIQRPIPGYLYIFDRRIMPLASGNTVIIGRIVVRAMAYDMHSDIENVSFYVNGIVQSIDTIYPYEWLWRGDIGYRFLQAVGYNRAGLKSESEIIFVYIFSL